RGPQVPQVELELQIAPEAPHRPRVVDDVGRIGRSWVAVGIEEPLKPPMDTDRSRKSTVVEDLHGNPLRVGSHSDRGATGVAAHHHAHRLRAVAADIDRSGRMLTVRVVPAVRPATPTR